MIELLRTNDAVLISFVESLLTEARIGHFVADRNMSVLEGSVGALPCRLLVGEADATKAHRLLLEAGVEAHLLSPPP